jgi:hypothetical protein
MPLLSWIDDSKLKLAVGHLLNTAKNAQIKSEKKFGKNVIDPFSAIFEIAGFEIDYATWVNSETTRQAQKTLQNQIGEFHQIILGSVKGWDNLKTGKVIDVVCKEKRVVAEIKNKYNTVSFGEQAKLYYALEKLVMPKASIYKGYTSYFVSVIPKKRNRYDSPFTPSDKERGDKCPLNDKIREIDGASFYSLVTDETNALANLFGILPKVIEECSEGKYQLKDLDKLKRFYDLAFE